jgi:curved DNA-binding protein CbpA
MQVANDTEIRVELEGKVLVAALKQSVDQGNRDSADFAHKQLFQLLRGHSQLKDKPAKVETNVYEILGLGQNASMEVVHKHFLRRVRKLLLTKGKVHPVQFLETLRSLWIAHDILIDPRTRRDYDQRVIGVAGIVRLQERDDEKKGDPLTPGQRVEQKIIKLIESSGLVEQTELEIARDMHKAMPEMPFGEFLLKQNFIARYQLDAILSGRRLLDAGIITLPQFQNAMKVISEEHPLLEDALQLS